ncbi:hypothetical protein BDR03DRAFT_1015182 [Suillus americanus]|nr:hypothetical protein BDR03DRAFT_1015182 [Suillus americanus]
MSHSLPALAFVLALQSLEVAGGAVYLREPVFMFPRDNGDHGDDGDGGDGNSSSSTSTTTTSTTSTTSSTTSTTSSSTSTTSSSTSTSTSQSSPSSSSTITTSGTLTSFSSSHTSSSSPSQNNGSSTTSQGLSTGARTGLAFGILFFLIFCAMLVCYLRKRSRRARESVGYGPALLPSEVSQYRPPDLVASRERDLPPPPPPQLDTAYLNSPDTSHASSLSAISSAVPLLSDDSHPSSHPTSTWNRYSTLSQASDPHRIATQNLPILPNPYDPFSVPARSASYTSAASSPTHSMPHSASIPASAALMGTFATPPAGSSSNIQPERRLSALHTDMTRHQKQLELDHRKRSIDAQEAQDPPPQYSS